jgi:hypothetical protein
MKHFERLPGIFPAHFVVVYPSPFFCKEKQSSNKKNERDFVIEEVNEYEHILR